MDELRGRELLAIAEALVKPRSKPFQYAVRKFGFCTLCNTVTEYHGTFTKGWCSIRCTKCDGAFGDGGDLQLHQYVTDEVSVPAYAIKEFRRMQSRKMQRRFLRAELAKLVATGRAEKRRLADAIKPFAALLGSL